LKENLEIGTSSSLTYDLLIKIYNKKNDYLGVINVLNKGIKYSDKKQMYRKLRKKVILKKILGDMKQINNTYLYQ